MENLSFGQVNDAIQEQIDWLRNQKKEKRLLFKDAIIEDKDLSYLATQLARFENVIFRNVELYRCQLQNMYFENVVFENCNLNGSEFIDTIMEKVRFKNCLFIAVYNKRCDFKDTEFDNTNVRDSYFDLCCLENTQLGDIDVDSVIKENCYNNIQEWRVAKANRGIDIENGKIIIFPKVQVGGNE